MKQPSLQDLKILNTRPDFDEANLVLSKKIEALGGISVSFPLQEIQGVPPKNWKNLLIKTTPVDIMIFVSRPSVEFFFKNLKNLLPASLANTQFIAIGSATAEKLQEFVEVSHFEKISSSENLFKTLSQENLINKHVTIVRGHHGRNKLQTQLLHAKAIVTELNVYQSLPIDYSIEQLEFLWNNQIDIVLFTSEQAMRHLWSILPKVGQNALKAKILLVLSERLQQVALNLIGSKTFITSHDQIIESLLQLKENYFKRLENES